MKSVIIAHSWFVVMLLLLLPLPVDSSLKSNDISTLKLSGEVISHLQGSRSRSADCPVLPPCRCVHAANQRRPSVVRVTCDSPKVGRRRVLRFSATASVNPLTVQHLSLAYAGLNALPAATFRHIKVCHFAVLKCYVQCSLGPFYGAIAVPSDTLCRCCYCCCCGHRFYIAIHQGSLLSTPLPR